MFVGDLGHKSLVDGIVCKEAVGNVGNVDIDGLDTYLILNIYPLVTLLN